MQTDIRAALDLGSSGVTAVVVEVGPGSSPRMLGTGFAAAKALRGGTVVSAAELVEAIQTGLTEAESTSGVAISSVQLGLQPASARLVESFGVTAIRGVVSRRDVDSSLASARAGAVPADEVLLHTFVRGFTLDGETGLQSPVDMQGSRLEVNALLALATGPAVRNVVRCVERANRKVAGLALGPVAAAAAVLTRDEIEHGVCVVDVGSSTTSISIYEGGAMRWLSTVADGGDVFTHDLARGLRTPLRSAEELKRRHGTTAVDDVPDHEAVEVPSLGGAPSRRLARRIVAELLEHRAEDLLARVAREIERSRYDVSASYGVVLTGGGSELHGFDRYAEDRLGVPLRVGRPLGFEGDMPFLRSPRAATALGLTVADRVAPAAGEDLHRGPMRAFREWIARAF